MRILLVQFAWVLSFTVAYGANLVLHFEPAIVELTGVIEQQTFPGPPGYGSIANGDEIERGWYLRLSDTVDVVETKNDAPSANSETERKVKIMQLTWSSSLKLEEEVRRATKAKKKVCLKGHLFHNITGHHHSRVLMWVDQLKEIE